VTGICDVGRIVVGRKRAHVVHRASDTMVMSERARCRV